MPYCYSSICWLPTVPAAAVDIGCPKATATSTAVDIDTLCMVNNILYNTWYSPVRLSSMYVQYVVIGSTSMCSCIERDIVFYPCLEFRGIESQGRKDDTLLVQPYRRYVPVLYTLVCSTWYATAV